MTTVVERLGWAAAAVVVSAWLALVEVFWLPLRVGGLLVPLSIVAAVLGNLMLPAAALRLSGSRMVALLPPAVWLVVAIGAMVRRPEGDLVMTGGGAQGTVNLAFLMIGVVAAAFSVGRLLGGPRRPPVRPVAAPAPDPARSPAG